MSRVSFNLFFGGIIQLILFKHIFLIVFALMYGLALAFLQEMEVVGKKNIKNTVEVILAAACLTSIDFMSDAFEINHYVDLLCYFIILIITIVVPICMRKAKKRK